MTVLDSTTLSRWRASPISFVEEVLHDPETGRWWITSCGWPGEAFHPVIPGSVAIRELDWR